VDYNAWPISIRFLQSSFSFSLGDIRAETVYFNVLTHSGSCIFGKIVRNNLSTSVVSHTFSSIEDDAILHEGDFLAISDCSKTCSTQRFQNAYTNRSRLSRGMYKSPDKRILNTDYELQASHRQFSSTWDLPNAR
jgi:hypothetical protein